MTAISVHRMGLADVLLSVVTIALGLLCLASAVYDPIDLEGYRPDVSATSPIPGGAR